MAATPAVAPTEAGTAPTRARRIGEIEGIRAVAALSVLVTHVSLNAMGNRGPWGGLLARLDVGVAIFFVLSGYLVYRPFARALLRAEPRPVFRRYLRHRLLRIVPLYLLVVGVAFLFPLATGFVRPTAGFSAAASGSTSVPFADLLRFVTFTHIYWRDSVAGPLPQAWTLATEMAFYLLVPALAWLVARSSPATRSGRLRRQIQLLVGLVVVAQLFRLGVVLLDPAYRSGGPAYTQLKAWLPYHLDHFAIGMACAVLVVEREDRGPGAGWADRVESFFARPGVPVLSWLISLGTLVVLGYGVGLSRTALVHGRGHEFLLHAGYGVVAAGVVLPAVFGRSGGGRLRRTLGSPPMVFLGQISYGIYLWQLLVIGRWVSAPTGSAAVSPLPARHPGGQFRVPFWPALGWTLVVTIALAAASWFLVERPWSRYRDRPMGLFVAGMWSVGLLSFATRIWAFGTATARNPGNGDPFFYHAQANMLADGVGFAEPFNWLTRHVWVASAIHPPLFTLWLTPASLIGARGFLSHKVMAAFAGVAVVVIAGFLARRLAGDRAGVLAAVLVALYPNLWIIDGTLWPEGLYTACVGLALLAAYRWIDRPTLARSAAVGAAVGAAILTRGEALLLLPVLCLPLAWSGRRTATRWAVHGLVMGGVALALLAPWTLRNLMSFDHAVPVSTNSEEVLYYANCPDTYQGPLIGYWSFGCQMRERAARVARGLPADPPGDEAQRAAAWGKLGRTYALDHKDRWPAVVLARVTRVWDLQHADNNTRALAIEGRPYAWAQRGLWVYRLLAVPGLIGLYLLRRRGRTIWPLGSMLVLVTATAIYAYGHVRFRTTADLVLVVGAAVALDTVLPHRRQDGLASPPPTETETLLGPSPDPAPTGHP